MKKPSSRVAGITLVELLVTVAVVAILAAGVVPLLHGVPESAASAKLDNDVATINQAVQTYRAHGGSLDFVTDAETVIARLKTRADARSSVEIAGLTGSMLDQRIAVVMQSVSEAGTNQRRAVWNPENLHFEIVTAGPRGVKSFRSDEKLAALPVEEESRQVAMKLASKDRWIWDYADQSSAGNNGPTPVPTSIPDPKTGGPNPPVTPEDPPKPKKDPGPKRLKAPEFSIPSGKYPITQFAMPVHLYNANPAGVSRILYAVNGSDWRAYEGIAIQASPGSKVTAYAEAIDPTWRNSKESAENYEATPVKLDPPILTSSSPRFDYDENKIIKVVLENPNQPGVSEMQYRTSGTPWVAYNGPFFLNVDANPVGAVIEARAMPTQAYYLASDISHLLIDKPAPWFSISGRSAGTFNEPSGGRDLASNLLGGVTSEFFTWGVASGTDDPSSLLFTGVEFLDISPGERFLVGMLDYYNGTIRSGSGADSVDLSIGLTFNETVALNFEFTLDLINTRNNTGTRAGDADFVMLGNIASQTTTIIGDNEYNLILEFGETTANGFASVDRFHVFEDARATGNIYARLELVR